MQRGSVLFNDTLSHINPVGHRHDTRHQPFQSHGDLVLLNAKKTPRAPTIEKAHMERFAEDDSYEIERSKEFLQSELDKWAALITRDVRPEAFPGHPLVTHWHDQRTACADY